MKGILSIIFVFLCGFKIRNPDYHVVGSSTVSFLVDIFLPGRPLTEIYTNLLRVSLS